MTLIKDCISKGNTTTVPIWLMRQAGRYLPEYMRLRVMHDFFHVLSFPYGTLTVNMLGCLIIGLLGGLSESRNLFGTETRGLILVGVLGGFTTFSAFGYETIQLLRDGESLAAFSNVGLHLFLGLTAVWIGYSASQFGT